MTLIHELEDYDNVFPIKKNKRQRRTQKHENKNHLYIKNINPKTVNQQTAFSYFDDDFNLLLHGLAGTGKTFISLYLALEHILSNLEYNKTVTIVRSVVPSRDMGFLPGNEKDKAKVYEAPYIGICNELFGRGDAYEILKSKRLVNFITTSFIRGTNLDNTIIIVDECQNMTDQELHTVMTRVGENSKIIFSGDFRQNDLVYKKNDQSGIHNFMKILHKMKHFRTVEFDENDIVRSALVKEYIIQRARMGFDQI